jgi:hypothetical protein
MRHLSIGAAIIALVLLLDGCGGIDSGNKGDDSQTQNEQQNPQAQNGGNGSGIILPNDNEKAVYTCSATDKSDSDFIDTYISQHRDDTKWPETYTYNLLSVQDIERAFTLARANDPTVSGVMVLPPKAVWESYNSSEKVLYLVNKARCDRGLKPFEGIDPEIESVASYYANYLKDNPDKYADKPHEADDRTPFERMQQIAGVEVGSNADFFRYGENIASISIGTSLKTYPEVYESEARAVYGWLYEDQVQGYGHRKFLLANKLVENAGSPDAEGLIGVAKARRHYTDKDGNNWTQDIIVMDGFDPKESWDDDLSHAESVPLYR